MTMMTSSEDKISTAAKASTKMSDIKQSKMHRS